MLKLSEVVKIKIQKHYTKIKLSLKRWWLAFGRHLSRTQQALAEQFVTSVSEPTKTHYFKARKADLYIILETGRLTGRILRRSFVMPIGRSDAGASTHWRSETRDCIADFPNGQTLRQFKQECGRWPATATVELSANEWKRQRNLLRLHETQDSGAYPPSYRGY